MKNTSRSYESALRTLVVNALVSAVHAPSDDNLATVGARESRLGLADQTDSAGAADLLLAYQVSSTSGLR